MSDTKQNDAIQTTTKDGREIRWWDCSDDVELLSHDSIDEAVDAWADNLFPDPLPETVTVYGFAQMELPSAKQIADEALERTLMRLDEDYANPEERDPDPPTDAMKAAALAYAEVIRAEYHGWMCETVAMHDVRVADYVDLAEYAKNVEEDRARRSAKNPEAATHG